MKLIINHYKRTLTTIKVFNMFLQYHTLIDEGIMGCFVDTYLGDRAQIMSEKRRVKYTSSFADYMVGVKQFLENLNEDCKNNTKD